MRTFSLLALPLTLDGARQVRTSYSLQANASSLQRESRNRVRNENIVCPVLAAMWRGGDLKVDGDGNMEMADLYKGLNEGLMIADSLANFQAVGIVGYDNSQKNKEESRNSCKPPGGCFVKRKAAETLGNPIPDDAKRWLNIFTMSGKQAIEHGISTGIRGGDTNMPPNAIDCRGVYPCKSRFEQFFGGVVSNDRFYVEDMMKVVCKARKFGDRGGEYAYGKDREMLSWALPKSIPGREWQMRGAMSATVWAFGRSDEENKPYLTMADLKALFLEGRYPDNWQRREHGCLLFGCEATAFSRFNLDVPCDVDYEEPFWQGSGCNVDTGRTCGLFTGCNSDETCLGNKCICNRGANLRTMCFKNGACQEQEEDNYSFNGFGREVFPADNPSPRGNP